VLANELHRQLAQALKLVAVKHHKTGGVRARHGVGAGRNEGLNQQVIQ
jgi:hypothetical protein